MTTKDKLGQLWVYYQINLQETYWAYAKGTLEISNIALPLMALQPIIYKAQYPQMVLQIYTAT
jgi:hypothetical protein